jgi:hypothetical protein
MSRLKATLGTTVDGLNLETMDGRSVPVELGCQLHRRWHQEHHTNRRMQVLKHWQWP